jgi:NAD kinase
VTSDEKLDKLVVVTRRTRLDELIDRFNTKGQARFYIEHAGGNFRDYEREHDAYQASLDQLRRDLDFGIPRHFVDRSLVPTYTFGPFDLIATLGQDGLVANVAKYAGERPIVGINPDPERFDGVLLPFAPGDARNVISDLLVGKAAAIRAVTLAEVALGDGQRLLAFNDLYVGAKSHVSARYRITAGTRSEAQSSSGILISTGAGSTGWMSSVFNMATGVTAFAGGQAAPVAQFAWEDTRLLYAVREPFISRHSSASIVAGWIEEGEEILIESLMPWGGVVFSDGVEHDFLDFNAGATGRIRRAGQCARLVVRGS